MIFTTARSSDPKADGANRDPSPWDANPEGRRFFPESIIYTCWLRESPHDGQPAAPVVLFEALCDHPGYIAANLAVRWHPGGERVAFIDQVGKRAVSLFEFDLTTREVKRLLDRTSAALIFDWSPSGSHLACVMSGENEHDDMTGIWIRSGEKSDWWKAPQSERLAFPDSWEPLERLRATKPAWTNDEKEFAFVTSVDVETPSPEGKKEIRHSLFVADVAARKVRLRREGTGIIRDIRWRPNASEIGFIEGKSSALRFVDETGNVSQHNRAENVRRFAGWNGDGKRLAYVVPEPFDDAKEDWALLFSRVKDSRDRVFMADETDQFPGRMVHSGVRVTFPQWSPKNDSLSLWGTYAPTRRSWLSLLLPWSLRPGDPAAILDLQTGEMTWMAVSPHEEAQVGHYYLLKNDYEKAWEWYAKSAEQREPAGPIKLRDLNLFMSRQQIHHDATFFEYVCLTKLNRPDEAAEKLKAFRANMTFDTSNAAELFPQSELSGEELQTELHQLADFITPLMQNAFITEVYLSLDAADDGVRFFRSEMKQTPTDAERLAYALCLSQLLLVVDDRSAYAELVEESLIPILIKLFDGEKFAATGGESTQRHFRQATEQLALYASGGAALLPLMSERFLETFSEETLREHAARWRSLRETANDATEEFAIDLMLAAALKRLNAADELTELAQRMETYRQHHPEMPLDPAKIDDVVESLRTSAR
ncbi:MAG: hypothetical protein WEB58_01465 [Planctomycetaceae bacterium]